MNPLIPPSKQELQEKRQKALDEGNYKKADRIYKKLCKKAGIQQNRRSYGASFDAPFLLFSGAISRVADMISINEMQDYRHFADYSRFRK